MNILPELSRTWPATHRGVKYGLPMLPMLPMMMGLAGIALLAEAMPIAEGRTPPTLTSLIRTLTQTPPSHVARRRLYAAAPAVNAEGWLDVRTRTGPHGLRYDVLGEGGSTRIRSRVLHPVLQAEQQARQADSRDTALSPDNYTMTLAPADGTGETKVILKPRRRDSRLVDGVAYLTPNGDLRRIEGRLAKSPSFWVRSVAVIRDYAQVGGLSVPVSVESLADVKMAGKARFVMVYEYESLNGRPVPTRIALLPRLDITPTARIQTLLASR